MAEELLQLAKDLRRKIDAGGKALDGAELRQLTNLKAAAEELKIKTKERKQEEREARKREREEGAVEKRKVRKLAQQQEMEQLCNDHLRAAEAAVKVCEDGAADTSCLTVAQLRALIFDMRCDYGDETERSEVYVGKKSKAELKRELDSELVSRGHPVSAA